MAINNINSLTPPFLKKGDLVEIIAPAKFVSNEDINSAIQTIEQAGFNVKTNASIFDQHNVYSGTIDQRTKNLQRALDNTETKAIFFARGGYGTIQIIDQLDFTVFSKTPKWLIGFSDITTILIHIQTNYKIQSIHGPMPYNFSKTNSNHIATLFAILKGETKKIKSPHHKLNKPGTASGKLVGGNLSILCSLIGSSSFKELNQDIIFFIEDVDEYLYHIERMIYTLERSGFLKKIKGLIIGQMTNMLDNEIPFGKSVYELIYDIANKYDYPICFDFPFGHGNQNYPMIIESRVKLDINDNSSTLIYQQ